MDEEELKKMREADAVASGLFGGAAFRPIGQTISNVGRAIASGQNPSMMAGSAGVNPLVSSNVPEFPSRLGPLIRTDYGLPPSERPEYRTAEMMWDATKLGPAAPTPIQRWAATPFRGNEATARAQQLQGLPPHLQAAVDRMNAPKDQVSQIAAAAPQPARKTAIQTPYGTVYATVGEGDQVGQIQNDRAFDGNTPFWRSGEMKPQSARLANIGAEAQPNVALERARAGGRQIASTIASTARQSFENRTTPTLYSTPSGAAIAAPTNRFGQPLAGFRNIYEERERRRSTPETSPTMMASSQSFMPSFPMFGSIYGLSTSI